MIEGVAKWVEGGSVVPEKFELVCGRVDYKGSNHCLYAISVSFSDAFKFLEDNISKNPDDWQYG